MVENENAIKDAKETIEKWKKKIHYSKSLDYINLIYVKLKLIESTIDNAYLEFNDEARESHMVSCYQPNFFDVCHAVKTCFYGDIYALIKAIENYQRDTLLNVRTKKYFSEEEVNLDSIKEFIKSNEWRFSGDKDYALEQFQLIFLKFNDVEDRLETLIRCVESIKKGFNDFKEHYHSLKRQKICKGIEDHLERQSESSDIPIDEDYSFDKENDPNCGSCYCGDKECSQIPPCFTIKDMSGKMNKIETYHIVNRKEGEVVTKNTRLRPTHRCNYYCGDYGCLQWPGCDDKEEFDKDTQYSVEIIRTPDVMKKCQEEK